MRIGLSGPHNAVPANTFGYLPLPAANVNFRKIKFLLFGADIKAGRVRLYCQLPN